MKNFWTNKVDKALRKLGFDPRFIDQLTEEEKYQILLEDYLFYITNSSTDSDCFIPGTTEELADSVLGRK
jgi:hypothetical protein